MPLEEVVKNVDTVKRLAIRAVKNPFRYKEIQVRNLNLILARVLLEKSRGAGYGISQVLTKEGMTMTGNVLGNAKARTLSALLAIVLALTSFGAHAGLILNVDGTDYTDDDSDGYITADGGTTFFLNGGDLSFTLTGSNGPGSTVAFTATLTDVTAAGSIFTQVNGYGTVTFSAYADSDNLGGTSGGTVVTLFSDSWTGGLADSFTGSNYYGALGAGSEWDTYSLVLTGSAGTFSQFNSTLTVPEPGVWALLLLGLAGICLARRQSKRA